jgi:very-short-patch-repair endonuclease
MKKLSQEDFISTCIDIHGDKYNYTKTKYINTRTKVLIICPEHGEFYQGSKNHMKGQGCSKCSCNYSYTKDEYINLCNKIHNNLYDYSFLNIKKITNKQLIKVLNRNDNLLYCQYDEMHKKGSKPIMLDSNYLITKLKNIHNNRYEYNIKDEYISCASKIEIIDTITGSKYFYGVDKHLKGNITNRITLESFKYKSSIFHNNEYDYSLIEFLPERNNYVDIICKEHGIFKQTINNHMNNGNKCPICVFKFWSQDELISEFKKIHGDKYNYDKVIYNGYYKKVEIICDAHGIFKQTPYHHLEREQGCKLCKNNYSKGEEMIKKYLDINNIEYIQQYGFDECRYINRLNFDFYLPKINICIEFDGEQHFKPLDRFGGENEFIHIKGRDESKNLFCENNNIKLIRIPYTEILNVESILKNNL